MISRRSRAAGSCALVAAIVGCPAVAAKGLDFNQFVGVETTVFPFPVNPPLLIDGFSLTAVGRPDQDPFEIGDLPLMVGEGSPRLHAINDSLVLLASAVGDPINLRSLDFGGSFLAAGDRTRWADKIEILGYRGDEIVGRKILDLDPTLPTPSLMTSWFGREFHCLSRVSFHGLGDIGPDGVFRNNHEFVLDNIFVTHAPEPETYAMLMAGLGLLAWRCRDLRVAG